jgi:hypothetical protein
VPEPHPHRIREVLQHHGLSGRAARAAVFAGATLRAQTQEHGVDFAATLDVDSGRRVGRILRGTGRDVDVRPHLNALEADRQYLALHTHPSPTAFSEADAVLLLAHRPIRTLAVVATDATWYVLSTVPGMARPTIPSVMIAFRQTILALRPSYTTRIRVGEISTAEAQRRLSHEVWVTVMGQIAGIRYDRIEP